MRLPTPDKINDVAELKEKIAASEVAIMTRYVGINVAQVTNLRKRLREAEVDYKVYKNTLATRALNELGLGEAAQFMEGPTAWAFSKDPVTPAKILREFAATSKFVAMEGGVLAGRVVTKEQLDSLATLPSRDQLLAQVVGTIAMPLRNLLGVLNAVPRDLVSVLDEIRKKKEAEAA